MVCGAAEPVGDGEGYLTQLGPQKTRGGPLVIGRRVVRAMKGCPGGSAAQGARFTRRQPVTERAIVCLLIPAPPALILAIIPLQKRGTPCRQLNAQSAPRV
jgi:hypothetical protein